MASAASYVGFRYPVEIISHAVWLYFRFALSLRDVSELMLARGVELSKTVRQWTRKFGQDYANRPRRRRPRPGDKWHLDERASTSSVVRIRSNRAPITRSHPRTVAPGTSRRLPIPRWPIP